MGTQLLTQVLPISTTDFHLCTRGDDKSEEKRLYVEVHNYEYMRPYYSIKYMGECVPLVFGNDER